MKYIGKMTPKLWDIDVLKTVSALDLYCAGNYRAF